MKIEIVFASYHHNNTARVSDSLKEWLMSLGHEVVLKDVTSNFEYDDTIYDFSIFASGIYYSNFHKSVFKYLDCMEKGVERPAFLFYTAGMISDRFYGKLERVLESKGFLVMGRYGILGYDTYGPYKLIGGLHKGRPNEEDINYLKSEIGKVLEYLE